MKKNKKRINISKATKQDLRVFGKGPNTKLTKIEKAYKKNYTKINTRGGTQTGPKGMSKKEYEVFKNKVNATKDAYGVNTSEAINKVLNTEAYTSPAERSRRNLLDTIRTNFSEDYADLKSKVRGDKGHFISNDELMERMEWNKDLKGYTINTANGLLFIDVSNSPEEVILRYVE